MSTTASPPAPQTAHPPSPSKKDALQTVITVMGLMGVLLTGIQYWAVDRYLAQFGVAPEEIGLDTAVLLTRVATALVCLGVLILPILLVGPGLFTVGMAEGSNRQQLSHFVVTAFRKYSGLRTFALSALVGLSWTCMSCASA